MKLILIAILLTGCAQTSSFTREQVDEYCSHSKVHRDIIMLGLTDKAFEPHSLHIHCGSEYGFPEVEDEK